MATKKKPLKKPPRKTAGNVPAWMKQSWATADKKNKKASNALTMRDVDAIIAEVRAEKRPENYKPIKLNITLRKADADFLKNLAALWQCSIEELIMNAVAVYRRDRASLKEDAEYFTNAIAASTDEMQTGRYEK